MRTVVEGARGCGVRVPGGLYLVAPELSEPCPRLPLAVESCPHCGQGIKPARGWTWVTPHVLFPAERHGSSEHNYGCPLGLPQRDLLLSLGALGTNIDTYHRTGDRAGLIWVGEKFYPTPQEFMREAAAMGVSRRITRVPRGFEVGKSWVYLGHRKGVDHSRYMTVAEIEGEITPPATVIMSEVDGMRIVDGEGPRYSPGVITLFKPSAIEYVVKGDETPDEIEALEKRGIEPVKVEHKTKRQRIGI